MPQDGPAAASARWRLRDRRYRSDRHPRPRALSTHACVATAVHLLQYRELLERLRGHHRDVEPGRQSLVCRQQRCTTMTFALAWASGESAACIVMDRSDRFPDVQPNLGYQVLVFGSEVRQGASLSLAWMVHQPVARTGTMYWYLHTCRDPCDRCSASALLSQPIKPTVL